MLSEGITIAGRYEILDRVGSGGMSDVYRAKDHTLGRYVAIKVLKQEFCEDMAFVSKFRSEAQSAAGLEHPNIVNVYDVGSENGFYYIIMEYVEGITLKSYIEKKGKLTFKESLSIAIQVGRGIQAAHSKNIIHRDIKPQNIIISTEGKVKVTDFGIARAASGNTIHSDVMGSVHYTSPEQARNGYVDGKSDIYSLGIVMYEMVTGRVPFDGDSTVSIAIQHLQDEMVSPSVYAPDLPISLEKIILKCTQKSVDKRYQTIEELLIDLRKALLNPDEDFVVLTPVGGGKTRVISRDEVDEIKEKNTRRNQKKYDDYDDDYDDDDYDDDDYDDDGPVHSRMDRAVTVMGIVAAIIIIAIVVFLVGSFLGLFKFGSFGNKKAQAEPSVISEEQPEEKVLQMIDIRGMTMTEAEDALADMGLKVHQKGTAASERYEAGEIISQDIAKGKEVEEGMTVNVIVSTGFEEEDAEEAEVPDVKGESERTAVQTLENAGFVVSRDYSSSDSVSEGKVISQTPGGGKMAALGSTITIVVSTGSDTEEPDEPDEPDQNVDDSNTGNNDTSGDNSNTGTANSTPTYSTRVKISAPENVDLQYADIALIKSESDEIIDSWNNVTSFPFEATTTGITGADSGTYVITWYYTKEDGSTGSDVQEKEVKFDKTN